MFLWQLQVLLLRCYCDVSSGSCFSIFLSFCFYEWAGDPGRRVSDWYVTLCGVLCWYGCYVWPGMAGDAGCIRVTWGSRLDTHRPIETAVQRRVLVMRWWLADVLLVNPPALQLR